MYAKYISKNSFKRALGYLKTVFNQKTVFKKLIINFHGTKVTYCFVSGDILS